MFNLHDQFLRSKPADYKMGSETYAPDDSSKQFLMFSGHQEMEEEPTNVVSNNGTAQQ